MHLVGFIIRIYHNAWSSECRISNKRIYFVFLILNSRPTILRETNKSLLHSKHVFAQQIKYHHNRTYADVSHSFLALLGLLVPSQWHINHSYKQGP